MSEGKFVKFAHLLHPALQKNERYKIPGATLHTWYLIYMYQVLLLTVYLVHVLDLNAPPSAASSSYENFLGAGLGSSPTTVA